MSYTVLLIIYCARRIGQSFPGVSQPSLAPPSTTEKLDSCSLCTDRRHHNSWMRSGFNTQSKFHRGACD